MLFDELFLPPRLETNGGTSKQRIAYDGDDDDDDDDEVRTCEG
jgi:hypothetical protein